MDANRGADQTRANKNVHSDTEKRGLAKQMICKEVKNATRSRGDNKKK
jgi:hypothetical protein